MGHMTSDNIGCYGRVHKNVSPITDSVFRCSNINWARRFDCNVCEHPKMGKVEERTGKQQQIGASGFVVC